MVFVNCPSFFVAVATILESFYNYLERVYDLGKRGWVLGLSQ